MTQSMSCVWHGPIDGAHILIHDKFLWSEMNMCNMKTIRHNVRYSLGVKLSSLVARLIRLIIF